MKMSENILYRRIIPLALTTIIAIIMFLEYYTGIPITVSSAQTITLWSTVIGLFGQLLGAVSLIILNIKYVQRKDDVKNRIHGTVMLGTLIAFIIVGLVYSSSHPTYRMIYDNINTPLQSAMMGVLGFYFITGAYRAFKIGNIESIAFMLSLLVILFMSAPIGNVIWPGFTDIGTWIQMVPNKAAIRGILIGVALGTIVLSYRTLIGREKGYLGE